MTTKQAALQQLIKKMTDEINLPPAIKLMIPGFMALQLAKLTDDDIVELCDFIDSKTAEIRNA